MVWKKNSALITLLLAVTLSGGITERSFGQSPIPWTDRQWEEAIEGLDYSDPNKKKEKPKTNDQVNTREYGDSLQTAINSFFSSGLGKTIMLFLVIGLLGYLIFRFLTQAGVNKDKRIQTDLNYFLENLEEEFEESDIDRLIRLTMEAGDYKTGVRLLFLRLLQQLHHDGRILWKKDKTNRDFLNEMRPQSGYAHFRELTLAYEIVWYGDTEIGQLEFERLRDLYMDYQHELNTKPDGSAV